MFNNILTQHVAVLKATRRYLVNSIYFDILIDIYLAAGSLQKEFNKVLLTVKTTPRAQFQTTQNTHQTKEV